MQTDLVHRPKHQTKQRQIFEPIIPGIGQSKQKPNSKRSISQFLRLLNNDMHQTIQQTISPQHKSSCPPIISPLKPSQINFLVNNSPKAKKQLSISKFSSLSKKQQSQTTTSNSFSQSNLSFQQSPRQYELDKFTKAITPNNDYVHLYTEQIKYGSKTYLVENIPSPYVLCHRSKVKRMKEDVRLVKNLCNRIKNKKYNVTNAFSRRLLGFAAALSPKTLCKNLEKMIPFIIASFLSDADFPFSTVDLSTSTVKSETIKGLLTETATDSVYIARTEILKEGSTIFLSCDKGHSGRIGHFVKMLSWWSKEEQRIKLFTLDTDDSYGLSSDCADAVQFSLGKMFFDVPMVLSGQTTDSGGGGTGNSFATELDNRALTCGQNYLVSYCTLHLLQLCLCNAVKEKYGDGGFLPDGNFKRNAMQLIHGAYNLQNSFPVPVWTRMSEHAANRLGVRIATDEKKCHVQF